MKTQTNRWIGFSLLGAMSATLLGGLGLPAAQASHKKWGNLAIAAAAVTGYGVLRKKRGLAIAGGLGTAYAYSRYRKQKKNHQRYGYSPSTTRYSRPTTRYSRRYSRSTRYLRTR